MAKNNEFLDKDARNRVVQSIEQAEARTSGEIRVYMEPKCKYVDAVERAKEVFASLGMEKTDARNAVIIYIAYRDRQFALFGDTAIYELAGGAQFWKQAAATLSRYMREGKYADGICACIKELGDAMAEHFPPAPGENKNELPDDIVFGK